MGDERYNVFTGCPHAQTATIVLRGGSEQFIEESHRSIHDALMVVKRCVQSKGIVAGGGAVEMEVRGGVGGAARVVACCLPAYPSIGSFSSNRCLSVCLFFFFGGGDSYRRHQTNKQTNKQMNKIRSRSTSAMRRRRSRGRSSSSWRPSPRYVKGGKRVLRLIVWLIG